MRTSRCYSVEDLQEILGVSKSSIYALLRRREFSWVVVARKFRISKKSFDEWLDSHVSIDAEPAETEGCDEVMSVISEVAEESAN